jgi:phytoene dehydrogenase-like protein
LQIGYDPALVNRNVVIVGGGIAGLASAIYLARAGRTVTIFEKRRFLGGRAITHLRHGFRFNLGPHAFYRGGEGWQVFRELGVPVRGGVPKPRGIALDGGDRHRLPGGFFSLFATGLLGAKGKIEAAGLLWRIRRMRDAKRFAAVTVNEWLDANVSRDDVRKLATTLFRVATYSDQPDRQSAAAALKQMRQAMRGVIYVDEGWQKLVDSLHSSAVAAGVNFVTSSRVVSVDHDRSVRGVELGGLEIEEPNDTVSVLRLPEPSAIEQGTKLPADTVILAVEPSTARELVPALELPASSPVLASSLDLALSKLPEPKKLFALGIDRPLYFSVHSAWAQLTPKGGALIHAARYGGGSAEELEALVDEMQPGWRDVLVHRRFLPSMVVSNALTEANVPRPPIATPIRGLYLAGDWVGDDGILSDASLGSARAAAHAIIAST